MLVLNAIHGFIRRTDIFWVSHNDLNLLSLICIIMFPCVIRSIVTVGKIFIPPLPISAITGDIFTETLAFIFELNWNQLCIVHYPSVSYSAYKVNLYRRLCVKFTLRSYLLIVPPVHLRCSRLADVSYTAEPLPSRNDQWYLSFTWYYTYWNWLLPIFLYIVTNWYSKIYEKSF